MSKNRHLISFVQPGRFRYLIGGVKTPPYERCDKLQFIECCTIKNAQNGWNFSLTIRHDASRMNLVWFTLTRGVLFPGFVFHLEPAFGRGLRLSPHGVLMLICPAGCSRRRFFANNFTWALTHTPGRNFLEGGVLQELWHG